MMSSTEYLKRKTRDILEGRLSDLMEGLPEALVWEAGDGAEGEKGLPRGP